MGAVGLNFGSPTSGDGFDVTSTVNTIVTNLQKIEQPWKDQLTSLQGQDTAISNLGSLLSALSTDLSKLTEFNGTLAQKTGASSDTNVVQLTSASTAAVAGTHTVAVNSLAKTSSGYLSPVADSSQELAGSLTIKVGGGIAKTITLNSANNTLSGLAAAINSSGAGITASVLTDATGSRLSLVSATSGSGGNIIIVDNSITPVLGAAVTAGATDTPSTATVSGIPSASETLAGTLDVSVGSGNSQIIDMQSVASSQGGSTLSDLVSYINSNSATLGFSAATVTSTDGSSSLQLTSSTGGQDGTLAVSSLLTDNASTLKYTSAVTGVNASVNVDGIDLNPTSNTVTNLIPGITFQLLSTSPKDSSGDAESVQVTIANDNNSIETAISQFVTDYNSLMSAIHTQEGKTSSGDPEPLYGSPTLSLVQQQVFGGLNAANPNGYLDSVADSSNVTLSGSISIQVGSNAAHTITLDSSQTSLEDLAGAINAAAIGVTAAVVTKNGSSSLTLTSQISGSKGAFTISSNISATTDTGATTLGYTNSSDINNVTSLGISANNDGSLTLDAARLDSLLNNDFASVVGFFQNANSWGQNLASVLSNAGSNSSKGILSLASNASSSIEKQLNDRISREEQIIASQKARLTDQLNKANAILQSIPTQLNGMDQLYSAITGYNRK